MASHHVMVLEDLLIVMLQNTVYKDPYQSMFDLCVKEIPFITLFGVSKEEMVDVHAGGLLYIW